MTDVAEKISARQWQTKVPVITAIFWVIKLLSTTVGETFADYLAVNVGLGPGITDAAMLIVLATAMTIQLRTRRYTPWIYWLCVVLVSIVGTQITDFFTDQLGVSLYVSTAVFAVVLAVVFTVWWRQERTLAITAIDTPRRERWYWAAILVTFALGTAGGDLATEALSLGFRNGALIFGGLILLIWMARRFLGLATVPAFWAAYVLTRPLGASLGDLLTQDRAYGGLGLGASVTSLLFLAVIVVLVAREQVLVVRHGIRVKGQEPVVHPARDAAWAGAGAVAVVAAAALLTSSAATAAPDRGATTAAGSTGSTGIEVDPTSPLGDLRPFGVIVDDVAAKVGQNDLSGGATRVKDLEVAWDDAEAAIKPTSPADWHTMDSSIDGVLTSLRASSPTKAACQAQLKSLQAVIAALDAKK